MHAWHTGVNHEALQVQETKESHSDSHTGVERMSVQRKLGDRARKIVRGRNNFTGEEVQDDVSVNMDSSHGPQFDRVRVPSRARVLMVVWPGMGVSSKPGRLRKTCLW